MKTQFWHSSDIEKSKEDFLGVLHNLLQRTHDGELEIDRMIPFCDYIKTISQNGTIFYTDAHYGGLRRTDVALLPIESIAFLVELLKNAL